jgi:hypothetical protein
MTEYWGAFTVLGKLNFDGRRSRHSQSSLSTFGLPQPGLNPKDATRNFCDHFPC